MQMQTLGRFQPSREIHRTALGSVWSVTPAGGDGGTGSEGQDSSFAAKLFEPVEGFGDAGQGVRAFLQAAAVQQKAAASSRYWAPVHETGDLGGRAFVVSDAYPRSAQRLIQSRVNVEPRTLHGIALAVVRGLQDLRDACGRSHGNLKPSNILIAGTGGLRQSRVVLADPAPVAPAGAEGEAEDLRACGEMLYELVLHKPFSRRGGWPVPDSDEWKPLGDGWRDLCNRLLGPTESAEEKRLDAVAKVLERLSPERRRRVFWRIAAVIAVPLLVLGAVGGLAARGYSAEEELRRSGGNWVGPFAAALNDPGRRQRYLADGELDPNLRRLVALVDRATAIQRERGPLRLLSVPRLRAARQTAPELRWAGRELSSSSWPRLRRAAAIAKKWRTWGWRRPAEFLDQFCGVPLALNPGLSTDVDQVLDMEPRVEAGAAEAEEIRGRMQGALREWDDSGNGQLRRFAEAVRAVVADADAAVRVDESGRWEIDALRKAEATYGRVAKAVGDARAKGWPGGIDLERFARVEAQLMDPLADASLSSWVEQMDLYRLVGPRDADPATRGPREAIDRRIDTLEAALREMRDGAAAAGAGDAFARDSAEVVRAVEELKGARFVAIDVAADHGEFARRFNDVDKAMGKLRMTYVLGVQSWMKQVPRKVAASPAINRKWQEWVAELNARAAAMDKQAAEFQAIKATTEAWRAYLADLDRSFPDVPPELTGALVGRAKDAREQAIGELIAPYRPAPGAQPPPATQPAAAKFADACAPLLKRQAELDGLWAAAQAKERARDDAGALAALDQLLAKAPDSAPAQRRRRAVADRIESRDRRAARLERFNTDLEQGQTADALAALEELEKLDPGDPNLPALRSRLAAAVATGRAALLQQTVTVARSEPDAALALKKLTGVVRNDPDNAEAKRLLAVKAAAVREAADAAARDGTARGVQQARDWYALAAAAGDPESMVSLGLLYFKGKGVEKNEQEAAQWLGQAAAAGNSDAMLNLGLIARYAHGKEAEAMDWFATAAKGGNARAMVQLGIGYDRRDDAEAARWYQRAVDAGNADALLFLGVLYEEGRGVGADHEKAMQLVGRAAARGVAGAKEWVDKHAPPAPPRHAPAATPPVIREG